MARPKTFTAGTRKREAIPFVIEAPDGTDDTYRFTPPKIAGAMMAVLDPTSTDDADDGESSLSMTQATWAWLRTGLGQEQYDRLVERLRDEDDDLDIPDVTEIVRWLMGKVSGRPTGSRRG